jgi:hypothetical protein
MGSPRVFARLALTATALALSAAAPAAAEIYKYKDPATGKLVITDQPPAGAPVAQPGPSAPAPAPYWKLQSAQDTLTDQGSCLLTSLSSRVGEVYGKTPEIVMRIGLVQGQPIVGIGTWGGERDAMPFDHDLRDLGVRIDTHPFVPVSQRVGRSYLSFAPGASQQLVQHMLTGKTAQVRVRFWPAERLLDGRVSLEGFADALETLKQCDAHQASTR